MNKLKEVNPIKSHLHEHFTCATIFFDLEEKESANTKILDELVSEISPYNYWGGLILRSNLNNRMIGLLQIMGQEEAQNQQSMYDLPLVKDIEKLNIYLNNEGSIEITEKGSGIAAFDGSDKKYHFSRFFGVFVFGKSSAIALNWSYNEFSRFVITFLGLLEGKGSRDNIKTVFGQVFEKIQHKT